MSLEIRPAPALTEIQPVPILASYFETVLGEGKAMADSAFSPDKKTVFIIGAGASKEVGLPVGSVLKGKIAKALDIRFQDFSEMVSGDRSIYEAFLEKVSGAQNPNEQLRCLQQAGWHIRDAMPQAISIDNFIDTHNENKHVELCGKLAIVRTILEAEAKSTLTVDRRQGSGQLRFETLAETWFNRFFQRLSENCKPADLKHRLKSVTLIIFNYDRCIEHYLYHAFQNYYSMSPSESAELLQGLEIYHPYGVVGSLPWQRMDNAIEFGQEPSGRGLLLLAGQIKTFTEGTNEHFSEVNSIRSNMKTAQRLIFLGFAFHKLNLEILCPVGASYTSRPNGRWVLATAHGISDSDARVISDDLAARGVLSARDIQIRNNLRCNGLFEEYGRTISFT